MHKTVRAIGYVNFSWQAGYYDHIVRNEKSLEDIYRYIIGNPAKWAEDEYYSG
jgi:putative transposase